MHGTVCDNVVVAGVPVAVAHVVAMGCPPAAPYIEQGEHARHVVRSVVASDGRRLDVGKGDGRRTHVAAPHTSSTLAMTTFFLKERNKLTLAIKMSFRKNELFAIARALGIDDIVAYRSWHDSTVHALEATIRDRVRALIEDEQRVREFARKKGYSVYAIDKIVRASIDIKYWQSVWRKYGTLGGHVRKATGVAVRNPFVGFPPTWTHVLPPAESGKPHAARNTA